MTSTQSFLRTYNPPIPVRFAGFESTTLQLQQCGWSLSMEQTWERSTMRLALQHEASGIYAMSNEVSYSAMMNLRDESAWRRIPPFEIVWMGSEAKFQIFPQSHALRFQPVDAMPSFEMSQILSFRDAIPFRTLSADAPEIIVDPGDVSALMEQILKLQNPKQAEIREKRRLEAFRNKAGEQVREMRPVTDIRAQIITLAS